MLDDLAHDGVVRNSRPLASTVIFGALALAGLVLAGSTHHHVLQLGGTALFSCMFIFALRSAQSSIKWDRRRVVARRVVAKTRRLAWSQIAGFEYREAGVLGARLQDGQWVRLMPYPRRQVIKPEQAIATLEAARNGSQ